MDIYADMVDRYCKAWSDPDAAERAAALASVWTTDATYTDPTVHKTGAEELLAHIDGVLAWRPGAKVERTSGVDVHHDIGHFAWRAFGPDGAVLREGIDIAFFSPDARRIKRIIGFFAPFAALQS